MENKISNKGFSLIELIIVIAIMAGLVAVIAPNLVSYLGTSKKRSDEYNANEIKDTVNSIVVNALTMEDRKPLLENIKNNYNGKIVKVKKLINEVDPTGEFEKEVTAQLKSNDFKCKRYDYNFYLQITVDGDERYDIVCKSVKGSGDELSAWPQ